MDGQTQATQQDINSQATAPQTVSPVADKILNDPGQDTNMTANQVANQGEGLAASNPMLAQAYQQKATVQQNNQAAINNQNMAAARAPQPNTTTTVKKTQSQIFGKSELLDANNILSNILYIGNGNRVADLGAGGGMFSLQAARLVGDQGVVYAVDIMKNTLSDIESKARMSKLYNIKTVWSNIEILGATKIPESSLDFVLLVNVLFQSDKHHEIIAEAHRLLKSGGKMLVIDWNTTSPGFTPEKSRQVDPAEIRQDAAKLNMAIEQEFQAGQYHFGIIFIKS